MHRQLPPSESYPLTPREITDAAAAAADLPASDELLADASMAAHFLYGAAAGSLRIIVHGLEKGGHLAE